MLTNKRVGFCICGSFCTIESVIPEIEKIIKAGGEVTPIMSQAVYTTDTRFGKAADFISAVERICDRQVLHTLPDVEPIGPQHLLDIMIIAPATGNTIGKLAAGIADTSVTFAAKAHLRNASPLVIAVSTNDGLGANGKNIAALMNTKCTYFVPYSQDNPKVKQNSLVADMNKIVPTLEAALEGRQLQPVLF